MATPDRHGGDARRERRARAAQHGSADGRGGTTSEELSRIGRFLLESAQGYALISLDLDGTITSWSAGAQRVFGWTAHEAVDRPGSIIFTPEDVESGVPDREFRAARERDRVEDERWHVRKDGRRFWGSGVVTALRDERGRLAGFAKIVRDLTDEKEAEQRVRASEERLRIALEAGRMGTWDWDIRSGRVEWSETLERIHGLEPGTFPGTFDAFLADVHPDDRAAVREAIERTLRERRPYEVSYRIVRPDGDVRWLLARGRVLVGPQGDPVRMVGICVDETARREAELVRARLAAIVESSDDAIIGEDTDGVVTNWNRGAERVFGYTAEEAVGRPLSMLVPPEIEDDAPTIMERLRRGERLEHYETVRMTKEGRRLDVALTVSPIEDAAGRVVGASMIARDITARKREERRRLLLADAGRALASSLDYEATLRRLTELAVPEIADGCAVYLADDGRLVTVAAQHFDPRVVDVVRELERRYPPDPHASVGAYHVLRTGRADLFTDVPPELLAQVARDEEHHRLLRAVGLRSIINVPLAARGRMLGVLTLVTTRPGREYGPDDLGFAETLADRAALAVDNALLLHEAEHRAREEEALRRAAEAVASRYTIDAVLRQIAASALAATDAEGTFVERLDREVDELAVVAVAGVETPAAGTRIPYAGSFAERVMERGRTELVPRLADAIHTLSPALAAFPDASAVVVPLANGGDAIGALFLLRRSDTPPFRDADLERAETFGRLASLAFGRVRLLEESQRRREELERVMESRARLVRGFSHDVKNPLGAADGHLELLETGVLEPLRPRQAESVRRARASVRSALGLIDELVDLARIQAGRFAIERSPVDIRALIRDIDGEYHAEAESVGLHMTLELPPRIPLIHSDPVRIRQILGNLLSNAVKYTPPGGRIVVRVVDRTVDPGERPAPGPGRWIAVEVSDTGPGIPENRQEAVFGEFTRLQPGEGRGAGLGLAISRRLARLLGGDVTLESDVGRGSTFTLWLPVDGPER